MGLTRGNYFSTLKDELRSKTLWRDTLAECFATLLLTAAQCALPLSWGKPNMGTAVQIALGMGFVVMVLAEAFGELGGAHMNPAVTVAMAVSLNVTLVRAVLYVVAQCLGATGGAFVIYFLTPAAYREGLATTTVHKDLSPLQGFLVEIWITAVLVIVIFGATNSVRRRVYMPSAPIGMAVALGIMSAINHTGASMNPARSLGPAIAMGIWDNHWVYWAGPIAGGLFAALFYYGLLNRIGLPSPSDKVLEHELEGRL